VAPFVAVVKYGEAHESSKSSDEIEEELEVSYSPKTGQGG
jgi:hypothetical protein